MTTPILLLVGFLSPRAPASVAAPSPPVAELEARAEAAWLERDRGFAEGGKVSPEPVEHAIALWEQALAARPGDTRLRFRLIEALYFAGHFAAADPAQARSDAERAVDLAEDTYRRITAGLDLDFEDAEPARAAALERGLAEAPAAHFWCAISWGVWGMTHSRLASARRGVAGRIRRHAEALIELDPSYADAGGLRLLGRLHSATPKVPLVTGWIDRERGIELLARAHATSTHDARNPLFLAEALLDHAPERRAEARALLEEVAARTPDPHRLVEESETLDRARELLVEVQR